MIGGVKLHSFLYDAKKLLREGCPRKVIRQSLMLSMMIKDVIEREDQCKLYHHQIHAIMRVLQKYHNQGEKRNKQKLRQDLIIQLSNWIKLNSSTQVSNQQLYRITYYITQVGLILLNDMINLNQTQFFMDYLSQFEQKKIVDLNNPHFIILKLNIHYRYAQAYIKFQQYFDQIYFLLRFIQAEFQFIQVISLFQLLVPHIYPSQKKLKTKIDIKSQLGKIISIIVMVFYQLSYIYEFQMNYKKFNESLVYSKMFNGLLKQQTFNNLIENRIDYFTNNYSAILQELCEINYILSHCYTQKIKVDQFQGEECFNYNNEKMYQKFNYDKLNKVQYFKFSKDKRDQKSQQIHRLRLSMSLMPKFSPLKLSHAYTMSELQSTTIGTSRQDSIVLNKSARKVQLQKKEDSQLKRFFNFQIPIQKVEQIEQTEQEKWIKLKTDIDNNVRDPSNKLRYVKLESYINDLIQQQMEKNSNFIKIDKVKEKANKQIKNDKEQSDKANFMIKQLSLKKNTTQMLGRKNRMNSYLPGAAKYQMDMIDDNCTNFQTAKNLVHSMKERRNRNQSMDHLARQKADVDEQPITFLKKAQNIILKHANLLKLQTFKKELKRHNSLSQDGQSQIEQEHLRDEVVMEKVKKKNDEVMRLLMDEYEHQLESSKTERIPCETRKNKLNFGRDLSDSTYCKFMNDQLSKTSTFTDMAFLVYKTIHQKKIKK